MKKAQCGIHETQTCTCVLAIEFEFLFSSVSCNSSVSQFNVLGKFSLTCCTSMAHAETTKIWGENNFRACKSAACAG